MLQSTWRHIESAFWFLILFLYFLLYLSNSYIYFVVIHDDIVLTAGHCLTDPQALWFQVFVGGLASGEGNNRSIVNFTRHPRYEFSRDKKYDFLLLKLSKPIQNAQLVKLNKDPSYPPKDELLTVLGYGFTKEDGGRTAQYLQEVQVPAIPDCSQYYSQVNSEYAFCAGYGEGGKDACQADSGGALLNPTENLQVGLVSWGRGCARQNAPGVYSKVSAAYSWIQHKICELSAVPPPHCVDIRVDITMDGYPEETEWSLLDEYGQEMALYERGQTGKTGTNTWNLKVPAGLYQFYMNDEDGICCDWGKGSIKVYSGSSTENEILSHDGVFEKELILDLQVGTQTGNETETQPYLAPSSASVNATSIAPSSVPIKASSLAPSSAPVGLGTLVPSVAPANPRPLVPFPSSSPVHLSLALTWPPIKQPTGQPQALVDGLTVINGLAMIATDSTLRVEIFYDRFPEETGWFLVNSDTNDEIFASVYDDNQQIPENAGKEMTLEVKEFKDLAEGNYWFVIADSSMNGICCDFGAGFVRIVQAISYQGEIMKDRTDEVVVEEHVLWEHNGKFTAFAEFHFEI